MRRFRVLAIALALGALLLTSGAARADGGKGVVVSPLNPKPGDEITVKADRVGADTEVEVRLVGRGVDLDLGEFKSDDEGDFTARLRLPTDLAPGTYQVRVVGPEPVATSISVVAAGGAGTSTAQPMAAESPVRERPLGETIGLVALFGGLAGLGLFFAQTAQQTGASRTGMAGPGHMAAPNGSSQAGGSA